MSSNFLTYFKKPLAVALILALPAPYISIVLAQSKPGANTVGAGLDLAEIERSRMEALTRVWQDVDKDIAECKEQAKSLSLASSLQNVIGRGIQKQLSQTISRAVSQNLESLVRRQVSQVLPRVIERGLSQQLPSALNRELRNSGASTPTPAMLQRALSQILPQIIRQDMSKELEGVIGNSLKGKMDMEIQKMLWTTTDENGQRLPEEEWHSPILQEDRLFQEKLLLTFGPGSEMMQMLGPEAMLEIAMSIVQQNLDAAVEYYTNKIIQNSSDGSPPPSLSQTGQQIAKAMVEQSKVAFEFMQQNLAKLVETGIANESARSISKGDGLDTLVQQILPIVMQMVLNGVQGQSGGMLGQLNGLNYSGVYSQVGGSYGQSDGGQSFSDWAGNDILAAAGFDFQPLAQSLADPIALSLVSGVGFSGYDRAIGNLATIGWNSNGPLDVSTIQLAGRLDPMGANYMGALRSSGFDLPLTQDVVTAANSGDIGSVVSYPGPVAPELLPPTMTDVFVTPENLQAFNTANPDFVGPVAPSDIIGADAAAAVDSAGSSIASSITGGFEALGGELAASVGNALVGGISGAVGSLVEGVPYVGGLLAPIAQRITALALVALLGPLGILVSGLPVEDAAVPGVAKTIGKATQATNKPLYTIQESSKTQVAQNTEAIKQQKIEQDRIFRDCMQNRATKAATRALEQRETVLNPATRTRTLQALEQKGTEWATTRETSATSRTGEKQPVTTDLRQNLVAARQEGYLLAAYRLRDLTEPGMNEMRQALVRAALGIAGPEYISGLTSSQQSLIWSIAERLAAERQAQEEKEFLAYGRNSKRECRGQLVQFSGYTICDGWWVVTEPGDLARATDLAHQTVPINAALSTDSEGEELYLEQLFRYGNTWLSANGPQGIGAAMTIEDIFTNGVADTLDSGITNLFNQAGMSINQFENRLTSGFNSGGFHRSDFGNDSNNFRLQDTIRNALQGTTGSSALQSNQFNEIIQAVIAAFIRQISNQNG